jgi:hypothetical protein
VAEYRVLDAESKVEITGKSSLHPIHGRLRPGHLSGSLTVDSGPDAAEPGPAPKGYLELPVTALSFGSAMYDRELPRRVDAARYPTVTLRLDGAEPEGPGAWRLRLSLTVHGVTQSFQETAQVSRGDDGKLTLRGSHRFDVRDFGIEPPRVLGMKVHPEFEVTVTAAGELVAP